MAAGPVLSPHPRTAAQQDTPCYPLEVFAGSLFLRMNASPSPNPPCYRRMDSLQYSRRHPHGHVKETSLQRSSPSEPGATVVRSPESGAGLRGFESSSGWA